MSQMELTDQQREEQDKYDNAMAAKNGGGESNS